MKKDELVVEAEADTSGNFHNREIVPCTVDR
jgi:hypothetical protein